MEDRGGTIMALDRLVTVHLQDTRTDIEMTVGRTTGIAMSDQEIEEIIEESVRKAHHGEAETTGTDHRTRTETEIDEGTFSKRPNAEMDCTHSSSVG